MKNRAMILLAGFMFLAPVTAGAALLTFSGSGIGSAATIVDSGGGLFIGSFEMEDPPGGLLTVSATGSPDWTRADVGVFGDFFSLPGLVSGAVGAFSASDGILSFGAFGGGAGVVIDSAPDPGTGRYSGTVSAFGRFDSGNISPAILSHFGYPDSTPFDFTSTYRLSDLLATTIDFDDDGDGESEFSFVQYDGRMDSYTVSATPVPEPGTMMLLGTGLLGLAVLRIRRFRG